MPKSLLMIHGVGCGGDAWDVMRPSFEWAGWHCEAPTLFPDQRVKENPPPSLPDLGLDDYIEAMSAKAAEMTQKMGRKPAVIGHSMGGLIAQKLAERGDVSQAIFLTPAQTKDCAKISLSVIWTFANVILARNRAKSYKIWRRGFMYGVANKVPKHKQDEVYRSALYDSGRVYGDLTDGIEIDASKIKIPTLTIAASHDRATLPAAVRKLAEKYAAATVPGDFREYQENAHWIIDEPGTNIVTADCVTWLANNFQSDL